MPCPKSSRSESWRSPTVIPSATVADIRLSSAARAATATAGSSSLLSCPGWMPGRDGEGSPTGIGPIVATGRWAAATTSVTDDHGDERDRAGPGRSRAARSIAPATETGDDDRTPRPGDGEPRRRCDLEGRRQDRLAGRAGTPSAAGTAGGR